jgi:RHH-type proline utilization regulon transcriptional repressor/proline dehydrogenase/delta 1-pyrroline-5-carboxylate dehydrogenase
MGVKIDKQMRQRLVEAAQCLERTPHWVMKHAIIDWLQRIEEGETIKDLTGVEPEPPKPSKWDD